MYFKLQSARNNETVNGCLSVYRQYTASLGIENKTLMKKNTNGISTKLVPSVCIVNGVDNHRMWITEPSARIIDLICNCFESMLKATIINVFINLIFILI